ncbi:MAG: hypothetical protein EOP23_07340 [Hyphomicrobiales bacterium]|nr:MAG: hypothetical protein EOP23_07340 [Hyphomicrobiales bacterium]
MTEGADDPGRLDVRAAAIIRAGLDRVLVSDAFRAAPQLSAFLNFVVERTVEGRAVELKGYTIAVEGLGRPADFNPQLDPIVRVEAGRLRRALAQYYAGEGRGDPVQISMPVGGYVPVFTWFGGEGSRIDTEAADDAPERDGRTARRWTGLSLAALALGLLALGWWYLGPGRVPAAPDGGKSATTEQAAGISHEAATPRLLRVAIIPSNPPSDASLAAVLRRFSALLVDAMARFDDLVTMKAPLPDATLADEVDYVIEIDAQGLDGGAVGLARLRSVRDGRIVWTTSSSRSSLATLQESDLAEMARRLATRLTEPFGIIPADARQFTASSAMRCILKAFDARRSMLPEMHLAARLCLAQLVEQDPGFYPAWAHLAIMTLGEHGMVVQSPEGDAALSDADRILPPLDRSLAAALTAVRLAPSGARAYQALMKVLLLRGATDEAIQMGREAQARNPYDPEILADVGALYVRLDRPLEGLPLLERAISLSVARPPRYDFYAFLGAYLVGAGKASEGYAGMLAADTSPLSLLGQALKAAAENDPQKQAKSIAQLVEKTPLFGQDPRAFFQRRGFSEPVIDKVLTALGLSKP